MIRGAREPLDDRPLPIDVVLRIRRVHEPVARFGVVQDRRLHDDGPEPGEVLDVLVRGGLSAPARFVSMCGRSEHGTIHITTLCYEGKATHTERRHP